ncbi:MAG: type I-C CRISPR-associated protein Cas8c/Csd1 [Deltaproteobacteria bacterium]|nr:type I-C CRISPR-associated protein Cas8c/Csd1 [Deltaproteobacteria bacterium]
MILSMLYDYYQRKSTDPDAQMAPPGFEWKEIPFIIELDAQGNPVQIEDSREGEGKKKRSRAFLLPQGGKKTSGIVANLLWDNAEYVLGVDTKGKPERVVEQHQAFIAKIESLPTAVQADTGVQAVLRFLRSADINALSQYAAWNEIVETNPNLTFRLHGDLDLVCQRSVMREAIRMEKSAENADGLCLLTGENDEIERLHTAIKGVWGAQTSGANIVSFNLAAFNSYGKTQGTNAPVGKRAAFGYTTALNHLLRKDSPQRLQVGDASVVFWADKPTEWETGVVDIFGEPPKDDPDRNVRAVTSLYKAINLGLLENNEGRAQFFALGLAPNAARIAIRFWHHSTVAEMAVRIQQHFDDLAVEHSPRDPPYLSLFRLLVSVATQGKADNIPPNLGGELMRSILMDLPYPQTLLAAAVRRIRAEHEVTYARAALIKACINRAARYANPKVKEELSMSLDEANANVGYRLGRLFAVLEKIQEEANPGINATIRDRYYGAAASTPVTVFSTLLKLKNHHLSKLDNRGRAVNLEKRIGEIMDGIGDFPAQLPLADQGRFAIGYYHQRQDFFKKPENATEGARP